MAEVQTHTNAGEMTQQFIEFVMMQSQNAALFLGQMPNPQTGEPEINLEVARMFIDQLVMIREKTKGNLTSDEQKVLNNAIGGLQMVYVEVSKDAPLAGEQLPQEVVTGEAEAMDEPKAMDSGVERSTAPAEDAPVDPGSKKRFTKSYG